MNVTSARMFGTGCSIILFAASLAAQTLEKPSRAVADPGVVTTRQSITPAGVQTNFQGRLYGVTFGRSSSEIWVLNGAQNPPGDATTNQVHVFRLDWKSNVVLGRVSFDGTSGLQGIAYDSKTDSVLVSGATREHEVRLLAIEKDSSRVVAARLGSHIAGALTLNRRIAAVPLIYDNKLALVELESGRALASLKTGIAPFGAAINGDGTVAYVSNWGGRIPGQKDLTEPTGLAQFADRVVVDAEGKAATGTVTRFDLKTGEATDTIPVELHPTAILWDEPRRRLYVANGNRDSVSVIDTEQNRVVRTIEIQPFRRRVTGIAPTALALSKDGTKLFVSCGGINAVAVVSTGSGALDGMIPTAWYPNGLSLSPDGKYLAVSTLLGTGAGWRDEPRKRFVHAYRGLLSVLPVPTRDELASYTTAVAENNRMENIPSATGREPSPLPSRIEHVVYIIKENRTYDQVFGDIKKGNGDPSLLMFGENVTPNQHRLANQFVLLDNFYATGGNSGDGHQWLTQADETPYCLWPGYVGRSYPFDGTDPIAYAEGGFIWDAALKLKKTVRVYGEFAGRLMGSKIGSQTELLNRWKDGDDFSTTFHTVAPIQALNRILAEHYPAFAIDIPDVIRARIFLADLKKWERQGSMPNLTILQLPSNHTYGAAPNHLSAKAMVADNDLALGQIVEGLSNSPFWKKMAVFVVEDDAQNGVDHVDGHRTVALAIGPYTCRACVDSTFYSHPSMLKTIELLLGLPSLSLFDLIANDMRASFGGAPDFTPYHAVDPRQSLFEVNPAVSALNGPAKRAALDSMKMRFDIPDAAPTERLNRILWHQVRGWNTPYPPVKHSLFSPLSVDLEDSEREEAR